MWWGINICIPISAVSACRDCFCPCPGLFRGIPFPVRDEGGTCFFAIPSFHHLIILQMSYIREQTIGEDIIAVVLFAYICINHAHIYYAVFVFLKIKCLVVIQFHSCMSLLFCCLLYILFYFSAEAFQKII